MNFIPCVSCASTEPFDVTSSDIHLTAITNGTLTIDTHVPIVDDNILLKNQSNLAQNGIYRVSETGSDNTKFVLDRVGIDEVGSHLRTGTLIYTKYGSMNRSKVFAVQCDKEPQEFVLGIDNIVITQIIAKNNMTTTNPTTSDDLTQDYIVGSRWINTNNNREYICIDSSTGSAVWIQANIGEIVSADGSINTHSDVALSSPQVGQVLKFDGNDWTNGDDSPFAIVSLRKSSGSAITTAFANVTFDNTDVETYPLIIEHNNTNTERVDIKETNYYQLTYKCTPHPTTPMWFNITTKLVVNDTTDIQGSEQAAFSYGYGPYYLQGGISATVVHYLTQGDYVTLQYKSSVATTTAYDVTLDVLKLDGVVGPIGPPGADGDMTWQSAWNGGTTYTTNQAVTHNGTSYVCILNHTNQEPPNGTYWDVLASKGDIGNTGAQGIQGDIGFIDWQGTWTSQNYTMGHSVEYNGSTYICILDTISNENPSNGTYWDLTASKGDTGTSGAGSSIIMKDNGIAIANTPHTEIDCVGLAVTDAGAGVAQLTTYSRVCDVYYKPTVQATVSLAAGWVDVPMNIDRTITSDFTHATDAAEITINTTATYMIMARCSAYHTGYTLTGAQFRLVRDTGGGYAQIEGTIGYLFLRGYAGIGYNTANVAAIMALDAGDKIKLQCDIVAGQTIILATEGCSILLKNV